MTTTWTDSTQFVPNRKSCNSLATVRRGRGIELVNSATEMLRENGYCQWALICKADGKLIGFCGFVNSDDAPEIGWRLAPEYWGQGLATEAARAVLTHGIETLGFQRVIATVQSTNAASIRVIEKLRMTLVEKFDRDGREVLVYSVDAG